MKTPPWKQRGGTCSGVAGSKGCTCYPGWAIRHPSRWCANSWVLSMGRLLWSCGLICSAACTKVATGLCDQAHRRHSFHLECPWFSARGCFYSMAEALPSPRWTLDSPARGGGGTCAALGSQISNMLWIMTQEAATLVLTWRYLTLA